MGHCATAYRTFCCLFLLLFTTSTVSAQDRRGEPNLLSSGYYVVDSYDNVGHPWSPTNNFIDTSFAASSWKRIATGPRQFAPTGYFFYNPSGWSNIPQMDTTDNAMAGPIPLGFTFNFYGVNYDSVYISSNGVIGFRPYAEAAGNPVAGQGSYLASQNKDFSSSASYGSAPPAIIAALWADLTFFRHDTTRIFVRTNATNDTFFVNYYNLRLRPGSPNVGNFTPVGGDRMGIRKMQIILAKSDSSIQIVYGQFFGGLNTSPPVLAHKFFQNSASIGLVNQLKNQATSVLFKNTWHAVNPICGDCNKDFTQSGNWSLKFKQWKNVVRAIKVDFPTPNYELCLGSSSPALKAVVQNVSESVQSFQVVMSIRNALNGKSVYNHKVDVTNLSSSKDSTIVFPAFQADLGNNDHLGRLLVTAIALPLTPANIPLGDKWPFDDTVRTTMYGIKRLTQPFQDAFNSYTLVSGVASPDQQKWIAPGVEVVDGEQLTFDAPSPKEYGGAGYGPYQFTAPVMKLDRKNIAGVYYSAGGDTLSTFPINLQNALQANVSFSYQRSGKRQYAWLYDWSMLYGSEHTILNDGGGVVRTGDSLIVEFKKPTEPGCNPATNGWTRVAGIDGGKDLEFKSVQLRVENFNGGNTNYFTPDFRVRLRLKAKYDGIVSGNQDDDEDPWYIDNFAVQTPKDHDLQVVWTRVATPYTKVPSRHAVFPIYVNVINHSRWEAMEVPIVAQVVGPDGETKYYEIKKFSIFPGDTVLRMPDWNARNAKEASGFQFVVHSWIGTKDYDSYTADNGTYSLFHLNVEGQGGTTQEFAYDDAGITPQSNDGNDWPSVVLRSSAGIGFDNTSGSFAMKFNLAKTDTLYGVRIYFGAINSSNDAIRLTVLDGTPSGDVPGDTVQIPGTAAKMLAQRGGDSYNQFWSYYFPKPLVLPGPDGGDDGYYWFSVSQLSLDNMHLGADISRGGAELRVQSSIEPVHRLIYDSPCGSQYGYTASSGEIAKRFAAENVAGSGSWQPLQSKHVKGTVPGIVIPMIRPLVSRLGLLPVEFALPLHAEEHEGMALLTWTTATEQNNRGFFVERMTTSSDLWEKVGFEASKVTNSNSPVGYTFVDRNVSIGTYKYRLVQMDLDGTETVSNVAEVRIGESVVRPVVPGTFVLRGSYPNPFDPTHGSTQFTIESSDNLTAQIDVYNALGQVVRSLGTHTTTSTRTEFSWDGKSGGGVPMPEGTYIIQVAASDYIERSKVHLTR